MAQLPGPPTYKMFNSSAAAEAYYLTASEDVRDNIAAGVMFEHNQDPNAYAIRIKSENIPGANDFYNFNEGKENS